MKLKKKSVLKDHIDETKRTTEENFAKMRVISSNKLKKKGTVRLKKK